MFLFYLSPYPKIYIIVNVARYVWHLGPIRSMAALAQWGLSDSCITLTEHPDYRVMNKYCLTFLQFELKNLLAHCNSKCLFAIANYYKVILFEILSMLLIINNMRIAHKNETIPLNFIDKS